MMCCRWLPVLVGVCVWLLVVGSMKKLSMSSVVDGVDMV